jgi:hypothetical protein
MMSDKSVLFDSCLAIVDDSPATLDKAAQAGILCAGLREPWNAGTGHPLFSHPLRNPGLPGYSYPSTPEGVLISLFSPIHQAVS